MRYINELNERFLKENKHIKIMLNHQEAWFDILSQDTDVDIADIIYGTSVMIVKGQRIKQLDNFIVVDYDSKRIFTVSNITELSKLYARI